MQSIALTFDPQQLVLLCHPFLATTYAVLKTANKLCVVSEYIRGGTLFSLSSLPHSFTLVSISHHSGELFFHLQREKYFSLERTRLYGAELVLVLEYLHSKDIIVRVLKPENMLLDSAGTALSDPSLPLPHSFQGHIILTDVIRCEHAIWSSGSTVEYYAPEILLGKPWTKAVDWWAFGCILYEVTRRPFLSSPH